MFFIFFLLFYIWILCKKIHLLNLDLDSLKNRFTNTNTSQSSLTFTPSKRKQFFFQTWILLKKKEKKSLTLATPHPLPSQPPDSFRFEFFLKKISLILAATPTHPPKKIIHLCIILWILVQSDTFGGHCDLYIMVQRFCLVSLTISNRKTSYRSLTQTAGSTSCPWTTILVFLCF